MHNVQVTPIIGLPQLDGWSHVTQNQSSTLIWNVSLHGNHARNVGRDLLDLISNSEPTNSADFYRIFQQVIAESQDKESTLSCAAIFFEDDVVTFATYDAQILLRRDSKVGTLLNGLETTKIIQGKAQPDDVFILATARAVIFLDEVRLKIKQGYDVDTVVTSLTPSLQLEENSSLAALAFIQIKASKRAERETVSAEPDEEAESTPEPKINLEPEVTTIPDQKIYFGDTHSEEKDETEEPSPIIAEKYPSGENLLDENYQTNSIESAELNENITTENSQLEKESIEKETIIDVSKGTDAIVSVLKSVFSVVITNSKKLVAFSSTQIKSQAGSFKENAPGYLAKSKNIAQTMQAAVQKISRRLFNQDVYVDGTQSKKIARYAVIVIVVLLVAAGVFGWWRWQRSMQLESVRADLAPLQVDFEGVAPNIAENPLQARDQIVRIQDQIVVLQQAYQDSPLALEILNSFATQVQTTYEEVAGREELQDLPIFFDLSSIESRFIGSDLALQDNQLWVLDGDARNIAQVAVNTKEGNLFTFAQVEAEESEDDAENSENANVSQQTLRSLTVNLDNSKVYALGGNILQYDVESGETEVLVGPSDELNGARMIRSYGENMYIFNPARQNIFRFTIDDDTASTPRGWVRSSQGLQYNEILSMTIDGDIWLGSRTGDLLRMRTGQPEGFTITGLERPFESDVVVYTQEGFDHVYILESNANRVVQLTKDGVFVREVVSPTLASVSSIVVSADESSILALSGSLIYELEL